jgi:hypothetical protein
MKPVVQEVGCQEVAAALAAGEVVELVVEGHLPQKNWLNGILCNYIIVLIIIIW